MQEIFNQSQLAAKELVEKAELKSGDVVVIGCSTSEVIGERIGTSGTVEVAQQIFDGLNSVFSENGIYIAAQCCEHLNRAIIVERDAVPSEFRVSPISIEELFVFMVKEAR